MNNNYNNLTSQAAEPKSSCCLSETLVPAQRVVTTPMPVAPLSLATTTGACPTQAPAPAQRSGAGTPRGWELERVNRLQRLFRSIEGGRKKGKCVRRLCARFASHWKNRRYKCNPERSILLSSRTLCTLYYAWRKGGRTAAALAHRYRPAPKIGPFREIEVLAGCLRAGISTFRAALRELGHPVAKECSYRRAVGAGSLELVGKLFSARRTVARLEGQLRRRLEERRGSCP